MIKTLREPQVSDKVNAVVNRTLARVRANVEQGINFDYGADPDRTLLDLGVAQRTLGVAEPNLIFVWMTSGPRKKRYERKNRVKGRAGNR